MENWFEALTVFEKTYWIVAIVGSILLVMFVAMTLLGGDLEELSDVDTEVEGDAGIGFQFLSLKNLTGFFTIFGWSGIACLESGFSVGLTIFISVICGLLMMFLMASLFYYLAKLQSSGTLNLKNAIGQIGEVYLTIGANRSKIGKVSVNVQGTLRELQALTDEDHDLTQSNVVQVSEVTDTGILIVNLINN